MCVSYCHQQGVLYWNHEDCGAFCAVAAERHGRCEACRHQQGDRCGLTNAPLPAGGGCCHYNVTPGSGWQKITPEILRPLQLGADESEIDILESLAVPYHQDRQGGIWVEIEALQLPLTYGIGTESFAEEVFDWSDCGQ